MKLRCNVAKLRQARSLALVGILTGIILAHPSTPSSITQVSDSGSVYPVRIGPWLVQPVAMHTISDRPSPYNDVVITATIRNVSHTLAQMPDDGNNGLALQIKTDKGYLYPPSMTGLDGRNPHFIEGLTPPGFQRAVVGSFELAETQGYAIPANAKPRTLIGVIGSVFGGGMVEWPLTHLPSTTTKPEFAYPQTGYLKLGAVIKQGPLSFVVKDALLQSPTCFDTNPPSMFWSVHLHVQVTTSSSLQ